MQLGEEEGEQRAKPGPHDAVAPEWPAQMGLLMRWRARRQSLEWTEPGVGAASCAQGLPGCWSGQSRAGRGFLPPPPGAARLLAGLATGEPVNDP